MNGILLERMPCHIQVGGGGGARASPDYVMEKIPDNAIKFSTLWESKPIVTIVGKGSSVTSSPPSTAA